LVTGYDIIFFWVARMVFSGLEHTGQVPFRTVFMHGLIRDPEGRKMSKSMGNGVDPLELIEEFGADALRLCLSTGIAPGSDTRFSREKCAAMRNFCNKLWNASRFVLMNMDKPHPAIGTYSMENGWIMAKCQRLIAEVTGHFEKYDLGIAAQKIYDFLWDDYCDWYIELCKPQLTGGDAAAAETARSVLLYVLSRTIQLLHPFAPFITEAIWQALKPFTGDTEDLIASPWPDDPIMGGCLELEADMERVIELIRAIRTRRGDLNVPAGKRCAITLVTPEPALFERGRAFITKLAYASELTITETVPGDLAGMVQAVTADARALLPLAELVDFDAERTRLTQEIAATEAELSKLTTKLSNAGFVNKAPAGVVAAEREKAAALATKLPALRESLAALGA
jgi:valyl-tRNA synthetase